MERYVRLRWLGLVFISIAVSLIIVDSTIVNVAIPAIVEDLGITSTELSGSAWAGTVHGHLGGRPPAVDLAAEKRLAGLIQAASPAVTREPSWNFASGRRRKR